MVPTETARAQPGADGPAIEIHGLVKRFAQRDAEVVALDGIDATVRAGTVTGLIGPDAAGKTTLLRILAGLLLPDAGSARALGHDVTAPDRAQLTELSYMPQRFGLYEDLSVIENLRLYSELRGLPRAMRGARCDELLELTGLAAFRDRLAGRLSGGMKQKLGVACALLRVPPLALLDEPTVGVDPLARREIWRIVQGFAREAGATVLISTAYLDEAERCDDVILLRAGRSLGQGSPDSFMAPLAGRCFAVAEKNGDRRALEARLRALPGVVDAIVQGRRVRVVLAPGIEPAVVFAGLPDLEVESLLPRFEDAFVTLVATPAEQPTAAAATDMVTATPETATAVPRPDSAAAIDVEHAYRWFGDFCAVRDVSFTVQRGEIFGLLGANGAGKTTTFRMLCGLLPASSGRLQVAGHDLHVAGPAARARIGYMAQKFSLYRDLTVRQNLEFFARAYGLFGAQGRRRIRQAVESFDLAPFLSQSAGQISLGYQQRLALAAALLHQPDILFLDEPTSGVDPLARREFWSRINALAAAGVTVLITTHFMQEAEYCDRIAIMADGSILAQGSPQEIRSRSGHRASLEEAFIALIQRQEKATDESA